VETSPIYPDHLVTVIVPCYNGAAFLEEALKSALGQSHSPVEILVIDDGSTDGSRKIAERFPIRYIRQENRGLSDARNAGVRESKGTYLVFLDADDRLKPHAIARGLRALDMRPDCAMAVGDHVFIAADGSHLANSAKPFDIRHHFETLLKSNFIEMISTVLFRRSVVEEVGGFNTALRVAEDYDLYLRIARLHPICSHTAVVAEYRKHGANASLNSELMLITTLRVLKSQGRYVKHNLRRLLAYCEGLYTWRRQYGRQLATELAGGRLRIHALRHKLLILTAYYPQGLLLFGLLRIMRAMGQPRRIHS
jgi:glycosyltransferase involved in cell wall biosynthesis